MFFVKIILAQRGGESRVFEKFLQKFQEKHIYFYMFEKFEHYENLELKNFSTMKVGGKAKFFVCPKNHLELKEIFAICKENHIKTFVLGNGSNVLFDDKGFDGAIISLRNFNKTKIQKNSIKITKKINKNNKKILKNNKKLIKNKFFNNFLQFFYLKNVFVEVGAGVNLFYLNTFLAKAGIGGLEWSYGIPASVGGFVVSNGGCFGHEIGEFVSEVLIFDGKFKRLKREDLFFEYRNSNLRKFVVLSVKLRFFEEKSEKISKNMQFFLEKKKNLQPCEFPSLGSVFKRVLASEVIFPAKVIDDLGLKGTQIGGAQVSVKHAGFIVNTGNATSKDVLSLVEFLEKKMLEVGIKPEREIIVLKY